MTEGIKFHHHPCYDEKSPEWRKIQDLYEGKHAVVSKNPDYLWPHELEVVPIHGAKLRLIRERRSRYLKLLEAVVSTWRSIFFKEDPVPDKEVGTLFGDNISDVDGKGTHLLSFIKSDLFDAYIRDGQPIVLTDAPPFEGESLADQATHRAYFEVLNVLAVKDWSLSKGQYALLRYEYDAVEERKSLEDAPKKTIYARVLSFVPADGTNPEAGGQYSIKRYKKVEDPQKKDGEDRWELTNDGSLEKQFPEMPVATIWNNETWLDGAAEQQLVVYNELSSYYNQLCYQAYQRVAVATQQNTDENLQAALSEFTVWLLPEGATVTVIEPSDTSAHEKAIDRGIDQLFKVAFNQTKNLAAGSKEAPGAETLQEMKEETVSLVLSSIGELENLTNQMIRHYAAFVGKKDFKGKVVFNRDINTEDVANAILLYQAYADEIKQILPWRKASLKKVVDQQNYSEEEVTEIKDAIDAIKPLPTPEEQMAARAGMLGGKKPPSKDEKPPAK